MANQSGMTEYTKWWIAHPWHVTKGAIVPKDCDCEYCVKKNKEDRDNDNHGYQMQG